MQYAAVIASITYIGLVDRAADGPSTGVCAWRAAGVCAWRTRDCKAFFLKISAKSQDEAVGMRKC